MKARSWQGCLLYLLIVIGLLALAFSFFPVTKGPKEVDFYSFIADAQSGQINRIQQDGNTIIGLKDDKPVVKAAFIGGSRDLIANFKDAGVKLGDDGVKFEVKTGGVDWGNIMLSLLPFVLYGALLFFLFRSARSANAQATNLGKRQLKIADLNTTLAAAYVNRGVAYLLKGDHDSAIADFIKAIELDPTYAEAYQLRGLAYDKKGEKSKAEADYLKAKEVGYSD